MVRETSVEKRLIKKVKEADGVCMKIMPVVAGYPDRLVLLPPGSLHLIETKADPKLGLRPKQRVFKERAAEIGIEVHVLHSSAEVDAWIEEYAAPTER